MLAHIAELDDRRLYLPAGDDSMFSYCVGELRLSEEAAFKRIHAARTARRFPAIFEAVAEGRLHLSAVVMLAPRLTEGNPDELLGAATHQSKSAIGRLLAERFPRSDVFAWVTPIPLASLTGPPEQHAPGRVEVQPSSCQLSARTVGERSRVEPLSSQSYEVLLTMSQRAHDLLCAAQALLGVPSREVAQVVERALELLAPHLQQRKHAATSNPRPGRSGLGEGWGPQAAIAEQPHVQEVIPWLRALGFRATEALGAAIRCAEMPDASLEESVRRALSCLGRGRTQPPAAPARALAHR